MLVVARHCVIRELPLEKLATCFGLVQAVGRDVDSSGRQLVLGDVGDDQGEAWCVLVRLTGVEACNRILLMVSNQALTSLIGPGPGRRQLDSKVNEYPLERPFKARRVPLDLY